MHVLNERIYNEMRSERASLWYTFENNKEETALIIKVSTPSIKAIIMGCPIHLYFGKKDSYFCIGIRIDDMPDTPIFISGVQKQWEEHEALICSMEKGVFRIFLYNEMDICLASSIVKIGRNDASNFGKFIENKQELYVGVFDAEESHALDCFNYTVDNTKKFPCVCQIPVIVITPNVSEWTANDIYFVGNESYQKINIFNKDEGGNFEGTIWSSLESIFPTTIYQSPQVQKGNNLREFTDVFAHYEYGSFLIEAKDLSIIQAGYNKNESKRLAGIQKQVEKAIKQLIGASNAFKRGDSIFDSQGNEIIVDRSQPPHCIILITELMTCGNWDDIINQLFSAMKQTGAFFHILDLQELIALLKGSSGNPQLIDYNLIQRCELCIEKHSIFVRGL